MFFHERKKEMKKKKGRYQKSDPKKTKNREYTSYEDAPLREYSDAEPMPQNLTKKFLKVFLILILSVIAVLALLNLDNLTPEKISHWLHYDLLGKTEGNGYPVRFNGTVIEKGNFSVMDKSVVYCSDTSVVVLNSNAGEYQNSQHSFANPIMSSNPYYSIIYNCDATGYMIINRDGVVHKESSEKKIFEADVAPNGTYAILNHGTDYLAELSVYKNDNNKKYAYSFADYYVNNVSINNDGTRAALSGVSANNGSIISVIYILDFSQSNYLRKYEFDESFIYDVVYLDNGNVFAIGNERSYFIDVENNKKTDIEYDMRSLTDYRTIKGGGLMLALSASSDGHRCDVISINSDGKKEAEFTTDEKVLSMDRRNDKLVVLTPGELTVYTEQGKAISEKTVSSDSRKAYFADDSSVYILGTSKIFKENIKTEK